MALLLARRNHRFPSNPSLIRFFSSDPPPIIPNASPESASSPSPHTDIKSTLRQRLQQEQQDQSKHSFPRSDSQSSRFSNNQPHDCGKNLSKFQRKSRPQISLEGLYKQNIASDSRNRKAHEVDVSSVRESFINLKNQSSNMDKSGGFFGFKGTLNSMPQGEDALPKSVYAKEGEEDDGMMTDFLTFYNEEELGEKLRLLRPEGNQEFSLMELNQRLVKLRQVEEKEVQARTGNTVLRTVISTLKNDAAKQTNSFMGSLGSTPDYKLLPPKEELVETYFHPDNLSSAEKMKMELTKVRDEFKMSESDCGSARVQVAQLTTKIKHLSSSLHKKDKHSRKGLLGMVQKRKKLLKYLRRTDWDSYCLVLSKLSLRDNPDYKF